MTRQHLIRWAAQGEGQYLEYKQRVPAPERMAKEVVAFANTQGGAVLIGVADDGRLCGVKDAAEEEFALTQALEQFVDPPVPFSSKRIRISRTREIIRLEIRESAHKPHFVLDPQTGRRIAYVRVHDKSIESSREARRLMRFSGAGRDILVEVGRKEHLLLKHLAEHAKVTVREFAQLAEIPVKVASQTLVHLTRARMLAHHADAREDYFTMGETLRTQN